MSNKRHKSCYILSIIFILLIAATALIFSQWQTDRPLMNLSKFSSAELFKAAEQKVKEGDYKEAQKYINVALEKDARNVSYLGESAIIRYRLGDYQGAIAEYQKILDQGSYLGFALNGMANVYRDQSEKTEDGKQKMEYRDKAAETYQKAIDKDANYIASYQNYAIMLSAQGDNAKAIEILESGTKATDSPELKATLERIRQLVVSKA